MRKFAVLCAGVMLALTAGCGSTSSPSASPGASSGATSSSSAGAGAGASGGASGQSASSGAVASSSSGVCSKVGSTHLAKTKFLLHAGLAVGAFHRYIYKPLRAGSFAVGATGRTKALAKAGAAALYDVHELRLAGTDAQSDPHLCQLAAPFDAASATFSSSVARLRSGQATSSAVSELNGVVQQLQQQASKAGFQIQGKSVTL
jgi:hypothetical protein